MILAFDPGEKTGWAIVDGGVLETGEILFKKDKELDFMEKIKKIYSDYLPDAVVIEKPFCGRFPNVIIALTEKVTCIKIAIKECFPDALIDFISPAEWKKAFGLSGNAKKKDIQKMVKFQWGRLVPNEHITDAIAIGTVFERRINSEFIYRK